MAATVATVARAAAKRNRTPISSVKKSDPDPERTKSSQASGCHAEKSRAPDRLAGQCSARTGNRQDGDEAGNNHGDSTKVTTNALTDNQRAVRASRRYQESGDRTWDGDAANVSCCGLIHGGMTQPGRESSVLAASLTAILEAP